MKSLVGYPDIFSSAEDYSSRNFGDDIEIFDYGGQIVVKSDYRPKNKELVKFSELLNYISFSWRGFHKKHHDVELAFEKALTHSNLPLEVRDRQRVVILHKPSESALLDEYLSSSDEVKREAYEMRKRLEECYRTVDEALRKQKKVSYTGYNQGKETREGQQPLVKYLGGQTSLSLFFEPKSRSRKKERSRNWRRIRFDMIFEMPEIPALVFSEVKPFTTLRNSIIEKRTNQLVAYDAWLKFESDENVTPLLLIQPTVMSHREFSMVDTLKERTEREIIPVCVTTDDFLRRNINERIKRAIIVEDASKKYDMRPDVVEAYRSEHKHLLNIRDAL